MNKKEGITDNEAIPALAIKTGNLNPDEYDKLESDLYVMLVVKRTTWGM